MLPTEEDIIDEEELANRAERQTYRTENAAHLTALENAWAEFRRNIRTVKGDHTDLATALKTEIDNMVDKAQ